MYGLSNFDIYCIDFDYVEVEFFLTDGEEMIDYSDEIKIMVYNPY